MSPFLFHCSFVDDNITSPDPSPQSHSRGLMSPARGDDGDIVPGDYLTQAIPRVPSIRARRESLPITSSGSTSAFPAPSLTPSGSTSALPSSVTPNRSSEASLAHNAVVPHTGGHGLYITRADLAIAMSDSSALVSETLQSHALREQASARVKYREPDAIVASSGQTASFALDSRGTETARTSTRNAMFTSALPLAMDRSPVLKANEEIVTGVSIHAEYSHTPTPTQSLPKARTPSHIDARALMSLSPMRPERRSVNYDGLTEEQIDELTSTSV
jgi:hypothetical protein